jgi:hypothetical protein
MVAQGNQMPSIFSRLTFGKAIVWLLILSLAAFILYCAAQMFFTRVGPQALRSVCANNLAGIGKAMQVYAADNGGYLPFDERGPVYSLGLMYPKYIDDAKAFECPSAHERKVGTVFFPEGVGLSRNPCSYWYSTEPDPKKLQPDSPLLGDLPGNHEDGGNVLRLNGRVTWESNERLIEIWEFQKGRLEMGEHKEGK